MNPASAAGARIMAEIAARIGEPAAALEWRRKAVQFAPRSVDDALALVRSAVQFNETPIAEHALDSVDERARNSAPYHEAAALVAQLKRQNDTAEKEWKEALRLSPEDKSFQLHLGIVELASSDPQRHAAGKEMLKSLQSESAQRSAATRALLASGLNAKDPATLDLANQLQSYPEATWTDRLTFLELLRATGDSRFSSYLTELESKATEDPSGLVALLNWMSSRKLNILALDYIRDLPAELLRKWPVPMAIADVYVQLGDWTKLEATTKNGQWARSDFMRHAYLARAYREQGKNIDSDREWASASKLASERDDYLSVLIQTASDWKWESETTDLLWSMSKRPEKQKQALFALYKTYSKSADTQGLYRVLTRLSELDPTNLDVENNRAQVSLLLDVNSAEAKRAAADVYQKSPKNPAYLTTYAYALLREGNPKEALHLMQSLTPEQLSDPQVSTYYGISLAANGDEKARSYLDFGKQANLLPEEKALIDKAYASLNSRNRSR